MMKKAIVGVAAVGAVVGGFVAARRVSQEMCEHSEQMKAHCREMAAHCKQMAAEERATVGTI